MSKEHYRKTYGTYLWNESPNKAPLWPRFPHYQIDDHYFVSRLSPPEHVGPGKQILKVVRSNQRQQTSEEQVRDRGRLDIRLPLILPVLRK